ncbi:MAG: PIN domain-containing protein [Actinomycetota bacterium]
MSGWPARPRVFFDSDVLIAGSASSTGAARVLLRLSELGLIEGVGSPQTRAEAERNLATKLPQALDAFRSLADHCCRWAGEPKRQTLQSLAGQAERNDLPILASAVENDCGYLVTFNTRHYHPQPGAISVVTPGDLLKEIRDLLADLA